MATRVLNIVRRSAPRARPTQARRNFGSHAEVQYTGLEATIRHYFPKDEHIVLATVGAYTGLYFVFKGLFGGSSDAAPAPVVAVAPAAAASGDEMVPSMFSSKFTEWSKIPGNMTKFEESCKDFDDWMKIPGNKEKYDASLM